MTDQEQTGPLWTEAVRAECVNQSAECGDIPCWKIPPGDGPVDAPYGPLDPCDECRIAVLTAERDALLDAMHDVHHHAALIREAHLFGNPDLLAEAAYDRASIILGITSKATRRTGGGHD